MKSGDLTRQLIEEALAIEAHEAKEAGALGYMARALVQATMPHSKPTQNEFVRRNGAFTLTILAPSKIGLPYGSVPRIMLAWLTTEAVRTRQREIVLGQSLSHFMRQLDMMPSGGRWGSITRLREQSRRLFTSSVSCEYQGEQMHGEMGFRLADHHMLWWDPKSPDQQSLFESSVHLSERFFEELIERPVPIDLRALKALKKSPLAIDIYCWLTYRMSYLSRLTTIPWPVLQLQFGSEYGRVRDFRAAFSEQLRKVHLVYPKVSVSLTSSGLVLKPSLPHIPRMAPLVDKPVSSDTYPRINGRVKEP